MGYDNGGDESVLESRHRRRVRGPIGVLVLAALAALLVVALPAQAARPRPSISIYDVQADAYTYDAGTGPVCTFTVRYIVDGLKGKPSKQWTVWVFDGSVNGQVGTVTKAGNGAITSATPAEAYHPNYTYPLDGASHTWTVQLYDATGTTVVASSAPVSTSCPTTS